MSSKLLFRDMYNTWDAMCFRENNDGIKWAFTANVTWENNRIWKNVYISTTTVPMVTKLDRMVNYHEGLLVRKSHDPLITWCCEITWHITISTNSIATKRDMMVT